ncbi:MAG: glycerol-3-phosphate 1-O-acyltransferase PlsY [Alphaproteobacteria bacterium]|nr:glycerol-3-phosphate 1-O-acyltransferase PlsY [Alphaproteobacteria bacterium]
MPSSPGVLSLSWPLLLCAALAYLVGSIPFGLILTRLAGLGDVRQIGSGNIGATNVLRTGRKGLAAATLLLDASKGALTVAVARGFGSEFAAVAALAAVLGHLFPVWLGFKGGKGVATSAGVLLAYNPPVALVTIATWLVMALLFRYSSLAAVTAAVLAPLWAWLFGPRATQPIAVVGVIALLVIARHAGNIGRLMHGAESKIRLGREQ